MKRAEVGHPLMLRVAVLASGVGSNLQALLQQCRRGNVAAKVTLVVSDKTEAGVLAKARAAHVPAVIELVPEPGEKRAAYDARLLEVLRSEAPDLIVLAGYMRIVGSDIIEAFAGRIVNIHPSLLPDHKGLHAVRQALAAGAKRAGCSTHFVTNDLDGGPVILQASLRVRPGETEPQLQQRILRLEHLILPRTIQLLAESRVRLDKNTVHIAPGTSWLTRQDLDLVSGASYGEGF